MSRLTHMRRLLFLCLLSGLFFGHFAIPQALSEATASMTGIVTGAEAPIVVFLQSDDKNPTRYYDGYQAAADKDGRFSFAEIKPGTYYLWAQAPGGMSAGSGENGEINVEISQIRSGMGGIAPELQLATRKNPGLRSRAFAFSRTFGKVPGFALQPFGV